jgi:hypothetical protein
MYEEGKIGYGKSGFFITVVFFLFKFIEPSELVFDREGMHCAVGGSVGRLLKNIQIKPDRNW